MAKLILSTGNIVSGGPSIIRKPGAYRSNLELTNSLRSNFLAAQEEYGSAAPAPGTNGTSNGNGYDSDSGIDSPKRTPISAWVSQEDDTIYVPRIDWSAAGLQEEPSQYEVTVKLFFLPTASVKDRAQYASEALDLVLKELRIPRVDLLIVSFPGMSFEGDCEWEADKMNASQGNDEEELMTWAMLEPFVTEKSLVKDLGIAEFGSEKLSRFLGQVKVRPTVDQINIKNCCNVPPPLVKLAKEQGIELLVHSDCTDILPKGTLRELLGHGIRGAGLLADAPKNAPQKEDDNGRQSKRQRLSSPAGSERDGVDGGLQGDLTPQWVVKYTAVVKDRGVIENKGYFAGAELRG
ncbi:Aldo/keto reductase [Pleurostoma richardsiae]|uniref:GCS light chain n=1 Tax=Pleurostoma richardsiae TaxID=41990 RepID=A0AA38VZT1_9PEZI|nr:Aldo/keto reductase [Pleurostoma richardsiae]